MQQHPIFPVDSSAPAFYGHQPQQNPAIHNNITNRTMTHCSVDPLDSSLCQNLGMHLPPLNGFNEGSSQVNIFHPLKSITSIQLLSYYIKKVDSDLLDYNTCHFSNYDTCYIFSFQLKLFRLLSYFLLILLFIIKKPYFIQIESID